MEKIRYIFCLLYTSTFIENMSEKINDSQIAKIIDIIEDTKKKLKGFCSFKMSMQVMFLNIYEVIK